MSKEFEEIFSRLTILEKNEITKSKIETVVDIIPLLLERVSKDNIDELAAILKQSVLPSICSKTDDEIEQVFESIDEDKNLLFDKEIQKKIQRFIEQRFARDKQVVIQRTSDISKFVSLMGQYLNDAITSSGSGSKNVLSIKEKIQSIDLSNDNLLQLSDLQTELINAASSIESEMNTVSNKLQTGKTKVQELEEKVNSLEQELAKTKDESMKDHLTGLLTRRAYNEEIKKIESSYKRHNTQYAVVFFDLDFFKKVNDTYGHECGDVILSTFAKILEKNTRDHDIVGRYGGEEFVAIVHFNLNRELLQYLKRIKTIVTANNFKYKEHEIKVTFSAGVAIRANHESYNSALQKADMLLFEAKENGRNQIKLEDGKTI
ncbi:GGDEF domain-containing protein [Poseidonibacter lekithochrous]|uniref:GGDEF domain-containing protein n=1 Tax=Poseidonibacter TaxID=2321187 RepID=UPI001C08FA16|nr:MULTISPECIES: GGDEF domain-containing protein [Poseidonibacter]MBU3013846.1 GGDEF domain-containing protein [Poseidonibacter lekithochrous]MDO6827142.1 GGDEF domain-containing protein [Poseidonibacter sp. 1_MG-2023]